MSLTKVNTVVVGGGQAGLAMSEHLSRHGTEHVVLERARIAERWRTQRWDSLVSNGPAWHDRLPGMKFKLIDQDEFATKEQIAEYFEDYARHIAAPIKTGVEVTLITERENGAFSLSTSAGDYEAENVVVATGPFQLPLIPEIVPADSGYLQIHSSEYRNPEKLPDGGVIVVGAGSSGAQIADEIQRTGRTVYLAVGPHQRPPRRYRGKDLGWWLDVLGGWDVKTPDRTTQHVTIAISGAYGGYTIDFREFVSRGMTLVGSVTSFAGGILHFAPNLKTNFDGGDAHFLSLLDQADDFVTKNALNLPIESDIREFGKYPECVSNPILQLDLEEAGIKTIIWATGFGMDFSWVKLGAFDESGQPVHNRGVSGIPGLYFLGLPWLAKRSSSFIFGVSSDAEYLADHIVQRTASNKKREKAGLPEVTGS